MAHWTIKVKVCTGLNDTCQHRKQEQTKRCFADLAGHYSSSHFDGIDQMAAIVAGPEAHC